MTVDVKFPRFHVCSQKGYEDGVKKLLKAAKTPSKLILLALRDLERAEADPQYVVGMGKWHESNGHCSVCLAGSVMAGTLCVPSNVTADKEDFGEKLKQVFLALDFLRRGRWAWFFCDLGVASDYSTSVTPYEDDPEQFKRDLRRAAKELAERGL